MLLKTLWTRIGNRRKWCSSILLTQTNWVNRNYRIWILLPLHSLDTIPSKTRKCAKSRIVLNSRQSQDFQKSQLLNITKLSSRVAVQSGYLKFLVGNLDSIAIAVGRAEMQPPFKLNILQLASQSRKTRTLLRTELWLVMHWAQRITSRRLVQKVVHSSTIEVSRLNNSDRRRRLGA